MAKQDKFDIEPSAIGAGCLALIGAACAAVVILVILLAMNGVSAAQLDPQHIPPSLRWATFLLRSLMHVAVGYVTASRAHSAKMTHALILGGIMALLGAVGFVFPAPAATPDFWSVIIWLLTIPLTLYGAKLAISKPH